MSWDSLAFALEFIAKERKLGIDHDDLRAAMGLPWLLCAAPHDADGSRWSMYARDAFLIEAGRLFGVHVRDIHPPQAARGLERAAEFDQHFDASYRPLIQRALEHHQPVLAWQGWPAERTLSWGLIRETCPDGIGFRGTTFWSPAECVSLRTTALERPPTQIYVVERITQDKPRHGAILDASLEHARIALQNELADRFGVVTGAAALDEWMGRFRAGDANDASARHAVSLIAGLQSGLRFLARHAGPASAAQAPVIQVLERESQQMLRELEAFLGATASPPTPDERLARLHRMREAASRAGEALARRARPPR